MTGSKIIKALESNDQTILNRIINNGNFENNLPDELLNKKIYKKYYNNDYYNYLLGCAMIKLFYDEQKEHLKILSLYFFYKSINFLKSKEKWAEIKQNYNPDIQRILIDNFDEAEQTLNKYIHFKNISLTNEYEIILNNLNDYLEKILTD